MNLHPVDWALVGGLLAVLTASAIYTKRYNTSVSGFLAANRCALTELQSQAHILGVGGDARSELVNRALTAQGTPHA